MQSRVMSLIEAISNVAMGYGIAVITQIILFPMFGVYVSLGENHLIGATFTGVSLVRSYILRRIFNRVSAVDWPVQETQAQPD